MVRIQDPQRIILAKKKDKLKVFIDLDGVCAFWEKGAAEVCGIDIEDPDIRESIKGGKRIETFVGGDSKMWPLIDQEGEKWWENLEKLPWTDRLIKEIKKRTGNFSFLTSPSNNPLCAAGKIKWIKKHFGEDFKDFLIGKNKHLCASSNTVLIDDDKKKCKKFEEYGGVSFLWPNPLKLIDKDIDIEEVFSDLFLLIDDIN